MTYIFKLFSFLKKLYNLPGIKQVVNKMAIDVLRERTDQTDNTIDDKIVTAVEAALLNENYRAVLNGKGKYAKIVAKAEKASKKA